MKVDLIAYTPEPLRVLWTAARTCYSPDTPQELWEDYPYVLGCTLEECGPDKVITLLRSLWRRGHHSVFEHVSLTYAVSGVSRVCLAQYSRHRIGVSLSVQSQRHVRAGDAGEGVFAHVVPPCIQDNPEAEDIFFTAIQGAHTYYDRLVALGIRKEDVRFVLPEATATNFVTTVNLRSLAHLYRLRAWEPGAQWEIRNLVREMVRLAQVAVPELGAILQEKRVWLY